LLLKGQVLAAAATAAEDACGRNTNPRMQAARKA
jgi:hypothetical protein